MGCAGGCMVENCCVPVFQAATAGAKDQEAVNFLEKKVKGAEPLPYAEAVQLAIGALQNVLSEDFKATDIEVPRLASLCIRSPVCCGSTVMSRYLMNHYSLSWCFTSIELLFAASFSNFKAADGC